jgi:uncharacterized protein YpuA (DUF1002 family)
MLPCYSKDANGMEWKLFSTTESEDIEKENYYDSSEINYLSENIVQVWVKQIPKNEADRRRYIEESQQKYSIMLPDDYAYDLQFVKINCKNKTFTLLDNIKYNKKNQIIREYKNPNATPFYIVSDSLAYGLYKDICPKKSLKKKGR